MTPLPHSSRLPFLIKILILLFHNKTLLLLFLKKILILLVLAQCLRPSLAFVRSIEDLGQWIDCS